jgi:hypothetical protein
VRQGPIVTLRVKRGGRDQQRPNLGRSDLGRDGSWTDDPISARDIGAYFLQMASVDVASWVGDDVPIALVGLGGVLFIGGRLSGSTGRGSDEAA